MERKEINSDDVFFMISRLEYYSGEIKEGRNVPVDTMWQLCMRICQTLSIQQVVILERGFEIRKLKTENEKLKNKVRIKNEALGRGK